MYVLQVLSISLMVFILDVFPRRLDQIYVVTQKYRKCLFLFVVQTHVYDPQPCPSTIPKGEHRGWRRVSPLSNFPRIRGSSDYWGHLTSKV